MKFESAQTYILVTLITLLIWLYAESENVVQHSAVINLQLVAPEGYAILDQSRNLPVEIVFQAASSVRSEVMRMNQRNEIKLELNPASDEPVMQLAIREELNRLPMFIERGARIETATPSIKQLRVEEMVTREIPVEVTTGQLQLLAAPMVKPEKIKVVLPRSLSESLPELKAEASLNQITGIDQLPANVQQLRTVSVSVPSLLGEPYVTIEETTVDVDFAIQKVTKQLPLEYVKINTLTPGLADKQFEITLNLEQDKDFIVNDKKAFLRNVILSGPEDQIARVENKEVEVQVILNLTEEDLKNAAGKYPTASSKFLSISKPDELTWENPKSIQFVVKEK